MSKPSHPSHPKQFLTTILLWALIFTATSPALGQNPVTTTYLNAQKQASAPGNPPAGYDRLWVGTDNLLKLKQPDGTIQFMPYYLSSLDGIVISTSGVLSQFAAAPGGGDTTKFLRGDGTWADAGAAGFALQVETLFTDNTIPAIFLKSPEDNEDTPFLRFVDFTDTEVVSVAADGEANFNGTLVGSGNVMTPTGGGPLGIKSEGYGFDIIKTGSLKLTGAEASASGVPDAFLDFSVPAPHTGITANSEYPIYWRNGSQTYEWTSGTTANQRAFKITAPILAGASAVTFTNAATFAISGAPAAGTNATITNPYAFWVESGVSRFDGRISAVNSDVSNPVIQGQNDTGTGVRGISLSSYGGYLTSRSSIALNASQTGTLSGNTTSATALIKREHVLGAFTSTGPVLQVEQATGTGNLLSLVNSSGTAAAFDQNGVLLIGGASSPGTATKLQLGTPTTANNTVNLYLEPTATTVTPLAIQANASQSADLFQVWNSAGTKVAAIDSKGILWSNPAGAASTTVLGTSAGNALTSGLTNNTFVGSYAGTALTTGTGNVFIGNNVGWSDSNISNCIIIGSSECDASNTATNGPFLAIGVAGGDDIAAANVAVFGSSTVPYNDWYFGRGYSGSTVTDITFQPTFATGADKAGADFFIRGGAGTGDGEPGTIQFQATSILASGSTAQTPATIATISYAGLELNAGRFLVPQIKGTGTAPSISAGVGAGTGASVSVTGTNLAGEITFTTGTTPTADGTVITLTFSSALFNAGFPQMTPANDNAASLWSGQETGSPMIYAECSTTALTIKVNGTLPESTPYKVNYFIPQ